MHGAISVGIGCLLGVLLVAAFLVSRTAPEVNRPTHGLRARVISTVDAAVIQLGRVTTAMVVVLAGYGLAILVCWPFGELAHALQNAVDWPVLRWFEARQGDVGWHHLWETLTLMGNRPETQTLTVVGAVAITLWWIVERRRRWWIPLFVIPAGYLFEKLGQMVIKHIVDRGHPPTSHGTWPSGGCARLLTVFGLIIFFILWHRVHSRRAWAVAWSALAFLAVAEAYSRTYLLKHWVTDVFGGLLYGAIVLLTLIAAAQVLDRDPVPAESGGQEPLPAREPVPAQRR